MKRKVPSTDNERLGGNGNGKRHRQQQPAIVSAVTNKRVKRTVLEFRKDAWTKDFEILCESIEEEQNKKARDLEIHPRAKLLSSNYNATKRRRQGEEMYDKIIGDLNSLGMRRTEYQKQFHTAAMHACLFHIYGEDYESLLHSLLDKYNLKSLANEVLAIMPRRYGKSTMVAMFAAVMLMRIPGIQIAIFSTGRRASYALMAKIVKFVHLLPGGSGRIVSQNKEDLYVATAAVVNKKSKSNAKDDESTSHLMSFPANAAGKHLRMCVCVCVRETIVSRYT